MDNHGESAGSTGGETGDGGGWEPLAPGVARRRLPFLDVTVGAVVGTGRLLVVDTGSTLREGAAVGRALRELTGRPVTDAVLTHGHFDHVLGTAALTDGPPPRVHAHPALAGALAAAPDTLRDDAVRHGVAPAEATEAVAVLRLPEGGSDGGGGGVVGGAADGGVVGGGEAGAEAGGVGGGACGGVGDGAATGGSGDGGDGRWEVDLGGRVAVLVPVGPGHTPHDLAVLVPGSPPVVFCGDLVEESGEPQAGPDADPAAWPGALDRLLALGGESALYVPGHGAVVDAAFVREQRDALAARAAEAAAGTARPANG